jgi:hypothetical protein
MADGDELDQTRRHDPLRDTTEAGVPAASGEPVGTPTGGSPESAPEQGHTSVSPEADQTTVLPPTGPNRWTARAGIPPAHPTPIREAQPAEVWQDQPDRRWWAPAAIALIALLLIGILVFGVWLIQRSRESGPASVPVTSASPTTTSPTRAPPPTTAPPSPTGPAQVAVPPVVGLQVADAEALLDTVGLTHRQEPRVANARPGTVVGTSPRVGTAVPVGTTVTLFVAISPPTTAAPRPTTAPPTTPG